MQVFNFGHKDKKRRKTYRQEEERRSEESGEEGREEIRKEGGTITKRGDAADGTHHIIKAAKCGSVNQ